MSFNHAGESGSSILVSCKQTRFHIESPVYQELDIEGLNITIASADSKSTKSKGKARSEGLEILVNATLKLKPGVHYALVGRNGTGKSTILRAISEKLIPGIPYGTRIAFLQQTTGNGEVDNTSDSVQALQFSASQHPKQRSVLGEVIERALSRDTIQREIDILLPAVDGAENEFSCLLAVRTVQHERLKRQLFEMDKDARLRSGTRGMQARKALVTFEKKIEESAAKLLQVESDISALDLSAEAEAAGSLLIELQAQLEPARIAEIEVKARQILLGLGFPRTSLDKPVSSLSGGWLMRCALAVTLLSETDILIMDEPTNFLDLLGILWLQRHLFDLQTSSQTTVILVSHDRDFIDKTCQETIIVREKGLTYFRGSFTSYEEDLKFQKIHLGRMKDAQDKQRSHMEKTIRENLRVGKATGDENKLRQAKSRQKKLDDRMGLQISATGGRFKLNRDLPGYHFTSRADIDLPADEKGVSIVLPLAPDLRFPGPLISLEAVTHQYNSNIANSKPVLDEINITVHMSDRIGVVGLNGCGKSTLLKLVTGTIKPYRGTVTQHPRLRLGYYSQHAVEELQILGQSDHKLTALALLTRDVEGDLDEGEVRALLGSLGLPGRIASDVPLAKLSGGQLVRLALSRVLWKSPQLLVLDEITTHLDFYTVKALSQALSEWNGAIFLVSHDRFLIRRVVEGENLEDGSDDIGRQDSEEDSRKRCVSLLKGGKLQDFTVQKFETSLEKRLERLAIS